MPTQYRDGPATITLDDGLEELVRSTMNAAQAETVRILEEEAKAVAAEATAAWYNEVDRKTGKSGDIQVVTTFDVGKGEVIVSIGSTDTRKIGGAPVAALVHRPFPTSRVSQKGVKGRVANPKAADGKHLVVELVRKPARVRLDTRLPDLAAAIAHKVTGG